MDKMTSNKFYDCLFDNQKVVIIDKYNGVHFRGVAKDITENLKKHEIRQFFASDNHLVIIIK